MTIKEVANKLSKCALVNCEDCKHFDRRKDLFDFSTCQALLIEEMAEECRKIAEHMEDDCK